MPLNRKGSRWLLTALLLILLFGQLVGRSQVAASQSVKQPSRAGKDVSLPISGEAMVMDIAVNWENVPEEQIPDNLAVTIVPDGVAFMASTIFFDAEADWKVAVEVHMGTRSIQFKDTDIEGLEHRILGNVTDGFTIEYYLPGELPQDDEVEVVNNLAPTGSIQLQEMPSQTMDLNPTKPLVETKPGESLTPEEYQKRLVEQQLRDQGYVLDDAQKTPYYIGIGICVALIVVVIVIRVLLGRKA